VKHIKSLFSKTYNVNYVLQGSVAHSEKDMLSKELTKQPMKKYQSILFFIGTMFFSGCAVVPKQVVDARELQQRELERVKSIYFVNMNNQLDAIEKYRLANLDIYEEQFIAQHSKSLNEVSIDGLAQIVETKPTGNNDLDHINLGKLKDIQEFFKAERAKVAMDIRHRREQIT